MANYNASPSNYRNFPYPGKQSVRPPKSPFPSIPSYADYGSSSAAGSKGIPKPREGPRHQRTSSESFLIEEQPSWLDDLLNEPETPVRRGGHRRSSSDSFAYLDAAASNIDSVFQEYKLKSAASLPSWNPQEVDYSKKLQHGFYQEPSSFRRQQNRAWEVPLSSVAYPNGIPSARGNNMLQSSGSYCPPQEPEGMPSTAAEKHDHDDSGSKDLKGHSDRREGSYNKPSASETDPKRAKQQFAQRSRVRKLQYIAELERNVQALEAEGSEVSAEIDFLDQRTLILSMENKALKQRVDGLAQEQIIKYMEQEMLEREIARLQALYQQQQQPQQLPPSSHRRARSRDLDSQFANLSLKHESSSGRDRVATHSSSFESQ